jgi:opacity protein-like surface antigen
MTVTRPLESGRGVAKLLAALLACGMPTLAAADHTRWYGTLGAGAAWLTDQDVTISEAGLPPANGSLSHDIGLSGSLTLGRYLGGDEGETPRWRAEIEAIGFGADRDKFEGAGSDTLGGTVRGYGGFANALYRIHERDDLRVWLGGGIGFMSVRLPNDIGSLDNCGCLGADRNGEFAWRLKLLAEKRLDERNAAFAELGYVNLPGGFSAASGAAPTRYDDFGLINLHVGLRRDF